MEIKTHQIKEAQLAEVLSDQVVVGSTEEGLDLLGNLYYQGFDHIILHEKNLTPDFFDLKTGVAGELLQKFSNYRVRLTIVGDFSAYQSPSLKDFIFESNKGRQINFVESTAAAVDKLSKQG